MHINNKQQFEANKAQVLYLTKMNEQQYDNFRLETARNFINIHFAYLTPGKVIVIMNTAIFRGWWNKYWSIADDSSILESLYTVPPASRLCAYRASHQFVFDMDNTNVALMRVSFRNILKSINSEIAANTK